MTTTLPGASPWLTPGLRQQLAHLWAESALFEHASVGSFAKFSLHLLHLGASADLLHACHQAALDEIKHARLCFALASFYGEQTLGPGPLQLPLDVLGSLAVADIVEAAIREGCVGETLASLEAQEAYRGAREPRVRDALAIITEDEAQHAELAWKFLVWILPRADSNVRQRAVATFADELQKKIALAANPSSDNAAWPDELMWNGRLSPATQQHVYARGVSEVVLPAARQLLPELSARVGALVTLPLLEGSRLRQGVFTSPKNSSRPSSTFASSCFAIRPKTRRMRRLSIEHT